MRRVGVGLSARLCLFIVVMVMVVMPPTATPSVAPGEPKQQGSAQGQIEPNAILRQFSDSATGQQPGQKPADPPALPAQPAPPASGGKPPLTAPKPAPTPAPAPKPTQALPNAKPAPSSPQPAAAKPQPATAKPQPSTSESMTAEEQQMLKLVNQERTKAGLSALTADMRLVLLARKKSQDMIDKQYFGHQSPTYGSPFDMMKAAGITYRAAGENLAATSTVEGAHTSLMNSPGHKANILNPAFTKVGIGIIHGKPYGLCITQMFIGN